jgi:hypothetical protein
MSSMRMESLEEIATRSATYEDFWLNLRDFLDGFYRAPQELALAHEPALLKGILPHGDRLDAYLGAIGEHLSKEYHFATPSWAQSSDRVLALPYFAFSTHEGRMFLLVESPTAFRARNIFISADALSRV